MSWYDMLHDIICSMVWPPSLLEDIIRFSTVVPVCHNVACHGYLLHHYLHVCVLGFLLHCHILLCAFLSILPHSSPQSFHRVSVTSVRVSNCRRPDGRLTIAGWWPCCGVQGVTGSGPDGRVRARDVKDFTAVSAHYAVPSRAPFVDVSTSNTRQVRQLCVWLSLLVLCVLWSFGVCIVIALCVVVMLCVINDHVWETDV